jgi:hypothetical protein
MKYIRTWRPPSPPLELGLDDFQRALQRRRLAELRAAAAPGEAVARRQPEQRPPPEGACGGMAPSKSSTSCTGSPNIGAVEQELSSSRAAATAADSDAAAKAAAAAAAAAAADAAAQANAARAAARQLEVDGQRAAILSRLERETAEELERGREERAALQQQHEDACAQLADVGQQLEQLRSRKHDLVLQLKQARQQEAAAVQQQQLLQLPNTASSMVKQRSLPALLGIPPMGQAPLVGSGMQTPGSSVQHTPGVPLAAVGLGGTSGAAGAHASPAAPARAPWLPGSPMQALSHLPQGPIAGWCAAPPQVGGEERGMSSSSGGAPRAAPGDTLMRSSWSEPLHRSSSGGVGSSGTRSPRASFSGGGGVGGDAGGPSIDRRGWQRELPEHEHGQRKRQQQLPLPPPPRSRSDFGGGAAGSPEEGEAPQPHLLPPPPGQHTRERAADDWGSQRDWRRDRERERDRDCWLSLGGARGNTEMLRRAPSAPEGGGRYGSRSGRRDGEPPPSVRERDVGWPRRHGDWKR